MIDEFLKARSGHLKRSLISSDDLNTLRTRIDEVLEKAEFCDGCAFCCQENVGMIKLEFDRINKLVQTSPEILNPQGLICPFLDFDLAKFEHNLKVYGRREQKINSFSCRIYSERPIICRIFPAPKGLHCRDFMTARAPDLNKKLSLVESELFPEMLIQKYYVTLNRERSNYPLNPFEPNLKYQIVPGWLLDTSNRYLELNNALIWTAIFSDIPEQFPSPRSCELEEWEQDVLLTLKHPTSFRSILEEFSDLISPTDLGTLLTHWELVKIIVPVDMGRRIKTKLKSFWDWLDA